MSTSLDPDTVRTSILVLGPWVIGAFADVLLQGILLSQFTNYYGWYGKDPLVLKAVVGGLAIITCLKSIQSLYVVFVTT